MKMFWLVLIMFPMISAIKQVNIAIKKNNNNNFSGALPILYLSVVIRYLIVNRFFKTIIVQNNNYINDI